MGEEMEARTITNILPLMNISSDVASLSIKKSR